MKQLYERLLGGLWDESTRVQAQSRHAIFRHFAEGSNCALRLIILRKFEVRLVVALEGVEAMVLEEGDLLLRQQHGHEQLQVLLNAEETPDVQRVVKLACDLLKVPHFLRLAAEEKARS